MVQELEGVAQVPEGMKSTHSANGWALITLEAMGTEGADSAIGHSWHQQSEQNGEKNLPVQVKKEKVSKSSKERKKELVDTVAHAVLAQYLCAPSTLLTSFAVLAIMCWC